MGDRQKKPYTPSDKVCKLWLQEKLSILRSAPSLNKKKHETFVHCMHEERFLLSHATNDSVSTETPSLDRDTIG